MFCWIYWASTKCAINLKFVHQIAYWGFWRGSLNKYMAFGLGRIKIFKRKTNNRTLLYCQSSRAAGESPDKAEVILCEVSSIPELQNFKSFTQSKYWNQFLFYLKAPWFGFFTHLCHFETLFYSRIIEIIQTVSVFSCPSSSIPTLEIHWFINYIEFIPNHANL